MNRRGLLAALAGAAILAVTACGSDEPEEFELSDADTCDPDEVKKKDPDCGAYDRDGKWKPHPWVKPDVGGTKPGARKPSGGGGTSGGNRGGQPRTRTGGGSGSRGSSGGGTRSGGGRR